MASLSALWARELQRFLGPFPCNAGVNAPCCAQFLVRSERLRAVPLGAWRALLNVSMGRQDPEYKAHAGAAVFDLATAKRWEDVRQLEFLWGILLGEPCVSPLTDATAYENAAFDERPIAKAVARLPGTWHHVGCFRDAPDDGRLMGAHGELNYHGTHVRTAHGCQNMALDHENNIAGLTNDGECWACTGCAYARHGLLEAACPLRGGPWTLQVYVLARLLSHA